MVEFGTGKGYLTFMDYAKNHLLSLIHSSPGCLRTDGGNNGCN